MISQDSLSSNRNILFGLLAVQLDFVSPKTLLAAVDKWQAEPDQGIGEILVAMDELRVEDNNLLRAIIDNEARSKSQHANSIQMLPIKEEIKRALSSIDDTETNVVVDLQDAADHEATGDYSFAVDQSGVRYQVLRPHAKGGLGEVMVAVDNELHREVALKRIQRWHADKPQSRLRFTQEAEITGRLEHPGIVPVYGFGFDDASRPYYAMRLIKGNSLGRAIKHFYNPDNRQRGNGARIVAFRKMLGHFVDVCHAIGYAHSRGILHRDIKPNNVLLGSFGETIVVDWGLAKVMGSLPEYAEFEDQAIRPSSGSSIDETRQGSAIGTIGFMSPEQAGGRIDDLGPASDVFSLGATLYTVLTGKPPFNKDDTDVYQRVQQCDFQRPALVRSHVSKPLESICLKAMSRTTTDRYATPTELAEDIERWLADEPVAAHRYSIWERVSRVYKRYRNMFMTVIGLLIVATVGLTIMNNVVRNKNLELETANNQVTQNFDRAQANLKKAETALISLLKLADLHLSAIPGQQQKRIKQTEFVKDQLRILLEENPEDEQLQQYYAQAVWYEANLLRSANRTPDAERNYRIAIKQLESLAPNSLRKDLLASVLRDYAALLTNVGRLPQAQEALQRSLVIARDLLGENDDELNYERTQAISQFVLADLLTEFEEYDRASELTKQATDFFDAVSGMPNKSYRDDGLYCLSSDLQAEILIELGKYAQAAIVLEPAIEHARYTLAADRHPDHVLMLAELLMTNARILVLDDETRMDGRKMLDESISLLQTLVSTFEIFPLYKSEMANAQVVLATASIRGQDFDSAKRELDEALVFVSSQDWQTVDQTQFLSIDQQRALVAILEARAQLLHANGSADEAIDMLEQAIKIQSSIRQKAPSSTKAKNQMLDLQETMDNVKGQ